MAKYHFEKLAENIKKDTKSFMQILKVRLRLQEILGPYEYGEVVDSPQEMCEEFSYFSGSVFTKEKLGDNTEANLVYK